MARKYLKAYMDWQGWKLLVRPTDKFLFVLCVLVIVGCVPDPGRIRLRYPNDFGFITGYFDRQQSTGYWEVQQIELVNNYIVLASRDIRGGNIIIHLLDVKNPYSPQELASYESILTKIDDMQVVDNYLNFVPTRTQIIKRGQ